MSRQTVKSDEYKGFKYYVVKIIDVEGGFYTNCGGSRYWFCGYVVIPENHKLYKDEDRDLLDDEYEVHGGITYRDWHIENSDEWVIGFDCNHIMDNPKVENAEYTESECKRLIDQLA